MLVEAWPGSPSVWPTCVCVSGNKIVQRRYNDVAPAAAATTTTATTTAATTTAATTTTATTTAAGLSSYVQTSYNELRS